MAANVGDNHFKIVGELIEDYQKSKEGRRSMVVMFEQTKEYRIMPKRELTPALWVEKTYVTYGSLDMMKRMVRMNRKKGPMDQEIGANPHG